MKRTLLFLFGLLGCSLVGYTQQLEVGNRVHDAYYAWRHSVYKDLQLSASGHERFLDLANTGLDLGKYSDGMEGLWDDSLDLDEAYELWKLYEYGKSSELPQESRWDSFQTWANGYLSRGIVPLLVVDFTYARLSDSFWLRKGYRIKEDSSGLEKVGVWRNDDVVEGYAFGVFPLVRAFRPEYDQFILDPRFILSESRLSKPKGFGVEIDGVTRELPVGESMKFHWKRGLNQVRFFMEGIEDSVRLALFKNPQFFTQGGRFVRQLRFWWKASWSEQTQRVFRDLPIEFQEIPVNIRDLESGDLVGSGANISVHYGKDSAAGVARSCMRRPLIFVEGIDFGYSDMPEGCRDGKCGNVGYLDLLKGKQWNSQTGEWVSWSAIEHTPKVLAAYLDSGYDIVYVDFWKGSDWIEHNAQVLEVVLKQISQRLCGEGMHVIGASMGGLVAKYALNHLEELGELGCIRSYTSFDSPHGGANIPLGMQQISNYLKGVNRESRDVVQRMLNARASREMLLYHFGSNNDCDPKRNDFLRSKYATALPIQPWKMAISNGSGLGVDGMQRLLDGSEMVAGSKLVEIGITEFSRTVLDSLISGCDDAVLRLLLVGTKRLLESTKLQFFSYAYDVRIARKDRQLTALATYGGGIYRDYFGVDHKKSAYDFQPGGMHDGILGFKFNALVLGGTIYADRTCFIPTLSALNVMSTTSNWVKPLSYNVGMGWLDGQGTGFDDYYVPEKNQDHVFFDSAVRGNAFWLLKRLLWLDRSAPQKMGGDLLWLGADLDRFVVNKQIESGSILSINHPKELVKLGGAMLRKVSDLPIRRFYLAGCGESALIIKKKGLLRLGSGLKGKQRTELLVGRGSTLEIESGGMLTLEGGNSVMRVLSGGTLVLNAAAVVEIWDGSSVIVEEGGKVVLGDGVDLRLLGSGSMFHVKGKMEMVEGATWRVEPYRGIELGLIKLSAVGLGYGTFEFSGHRNSILLTGNGKSNGVVMQLEGSVDLRHGVENFSVRESDVLLGKSTTVWLRGAIGFDECLLGSRSWSFQSGNRWKLDSGTLNFTHSQLEGLSGGMVLGFGMEVDEFSDNRFMDNDTGLVLELPSFELENNRFENNEMGVFISGVQAGNRLITQGYWLSNSRGMVLQSKGTASAGALFMRDNYFVNNGLGLMSTGMSLGLSCVNFAYNDTGLMQRSGVLALGWGSGLRYIADTVSLANNTFDKNNAAHLLLDSVEVYWRGSNNFRMDRSYTSIKPMIRGTVLNADLSSTGNPVLPMGKVYFWPKNAGLFAQTFSKHVHISYRGSLCEGNGVGLDSLNRTCYVPLMVWNGSKSELDPGMADMDSVYTIPKSGPVVVRIYDLQGRLLQKDSDFNKIRELVAPGIYLVEWEFGHGKEIKKVLIDK